MTCGFTLDHYKECISLAKDKGYTIIPVKDYQENKAKVKKVILLRHDVDFSLEMAYELANIEYDLNVRSSYYIYLHSELYNALSPKSMGMIKEMKNMRHEIGLHADGTSYIYNEEKILNELVESINTFSNHNPRLTEKLLIPYLDNPNDFTKLKYISDSGRNWREGCMCTHIGKEDKLHILIHPEWWVTNSASREDGIHKLWQSQLETVVRNMTEIKQLLVEYVRDDLKL